jgi:hypothetical protein
MEVPTTCHRRGGVSAGLPPGLIKSMVKKRRENRKQKPQEEGKGARGCGPRGHGFVTHKILTWKAVENSPVGEETSSKDVFPVPTIFYAKMHMCKYEQ